jgi:hypothetical protein
MGVHRILHKYVLGHERPRVLIESHEEITEGHYAGKATTQKVLSTGLW